MTNTQQHGEASVRIVPYNPAWPSLFQQERSLLEAALGKWLAGPVEHFGSTAVPRLPAKPVIDIMAGVESLDASRDAIAAAGGLGYVYYPLPARCHALVLQALGGVPHAPSASRAVQQPAVDRAAGVPRLPAKGLGGGRQYADLKGRLATEFEFDRESYTDAKGPFIQHVLGLALAGGSHG